MPLRLMFHGLRLLKEPNDGSHDELNAHGEW